MKKNFKFFAVSLFFYLMIGYGLGLIGLQGDLLPDHLKDLKHNDYSISFLRWIPRSWTVVNMVEPPILMMGSAHYPLDLAKGGGAMGPKPVPPPGMWQISVVQSKKGWPFYLPYFALTTKDLVHFRFGVRWDDVDHYYVFPSIAAHSLN